MDPQPHDSELDGVVPSDQPSPNDHANKSSDGSKSVFWQYVPHLSVALVSFAAQYPELLDLLNGINAGGARHGPS